ncbi:ribonucleases P/MRP protein subunit POP1 [Trichomycterus rosablanca]|uniref:ribonucleases P/MRP protein subunit POP1 n=1 Tax=Trichomycterus rosablanca TaxID=2290929 RepID=UPI002F3566C6
MSGAKDRMRHKKMKNQPSNVVYSSRDWKSSQYQNSGGQSSQHSPLQHTRGPQSGGSQKPVGWTRGRQDGGVPQNEALPKYITASLFAKARAAEINAMLKAVNKPTSTSHVYGSLPKHMRRRAMSHNTKRLPCRLREMAHRMLEKSQQVGKKEQSKTKSRRARRRHGNLLLEFNRRQRKNKWLETHIWHAKRFHMLKKWGYCLGDRPTYKCYRSSYRAMSTGCLLQDISYYCCLELCGPEKQLLNALSRLTSKDAGPTFAAAMCISGQREGSVHLYKPDQYPHQPLGPVRFLWRPCSAGSSHRQLWIWVHPTLKQDLLPELQAVCQCSEAVSPAVEAEPSLTATAPVDASSEPPGTGRKRKRQDDSSIYPPAKRILGDGTRLSTTPVSWKSSQTDIVISDLTLELVRYRLTGPLSHSVLCETLQPSTGSEPDGQMAEHSQSATGPSLFWWPEESKNKDSMFLNQQQADVFQLLRGVHSTAELPPGCVLGMTVDDPRLTLPAKREKTMPEQELTQSGDEKLRNLLLRGVPSFCAQSALWDPTVRDNVTHNKISVKDINNMRRELLVPGSRLPTPAQGRVPILLVHQAGKQQGEERPGWGSGWDVLLPKGWGMAFWIPLVYRGVRVGGLHMSLKHSQNKGVPHFPHDYPDCPAGHRFQEQQELELLAKFKRYPPSKRTNYIKHGCLAPFRCPWQQLVEEWDEIVKQDKSVQMEGVTPHTGDCQTSTSAFTVLRSRRTLRQLSICCQPPSGAQRVQRGGSAPSLSTLFDTAQQGDRRRCLLWVRVCILGKGRPALHSMLCIPTADDLQYLRKDRRCSGPMEPQHKDHLYPLLKRRSKKCKATSHDSVLKQDGTSSHLKDDSSAMSKTEPEKSDLVSLGEANPDPAPADKLNSVSDSSDSFTGLVRGLWNDPLPSVTSHCSRVTLGWVTQGDFSLATGQGEALGFVSLTGFLHMLHNQPADLRGIVLLRNPSSLQYRYARLHVEA